MGKRANWTLAARTRELELKNKRNAAARRAANPALPPYLPRCAQGPSKLPIVAPGLELAGQSTAHDGKGEISIQWDLARRAGSEPQPIPPDFALTKISQAVRGDGTEVLRHLSWNRSEADRAAATFAAYEAHASAYRGLAEIAPTPGVANSDLCTVYPLGDPHVGMLAWAPEAGSHFDVNIACRELLTCVVELVAAAPASERAIITNLGDFLHAQDDSAMTPGHGNKLDVDGRFAKVLEAGHTLLRGIVDAALTKHRHVTIRNLPGNHDPRVAAELAMWLRAVYEREPRVAVADAYAAHQYDRFGACLFGWHHGDRTPGNELPAIMATDRASDWGETTCRVWHCGHVHHLSRKESPGCVVETHRTLAAGDAWHASRYRAGRSLQAITYHREFGETARAIVGIERVRAALKGTAAA